MCATRDGGRSDLPRGRTECPRLGGAFPRRASVEGHQAGERYHFLRHPSRENMTASQVNLRKILSEDEVPGKIAADILLQGPHHLARLFPEVRQH